MPIVNSSSIYNDRENLIRKIFLGKLKFILENSEQGKHKDKVNEYPTPMNLKRNVEKNPDMKSPPMTIYLSTKE